MVRRTTLALLPLALAGTLLSPTSAQAEDSPPVVTGITTENTGGGLNPYLPLYTSVAISFTDETPSAKRDYKVQVPGVKASEFYVQAGGAPGTFIARGPAYGLAVGEESQFRIVELADGEVLGKSDPAPFTFTYVGHPRSLQTSSKKVDGEWSYRAGTRARLEFTGAWERGTTISTRVWVSRTRKFTQRDWNFNTGKDGALVEKSRVDEPVLSFRVPRKHVGKYVWVSVRGWKEGEGGWTFEIPAEKIIRRG